MTKLINTIKELTNKNPNLPFSVYASSHEQRLLNVPIVKPLLIAVLGGDKNLGKNNEITCKAGQFIFLSDSPAINMRNIPNHQEYFALLIDFDYEDFTDIPKNTKKKSDYIIGNINPPIEQILQQYVECSDWAPNEIIKSRKREILLLLYCLGHPQISSMSGKPKISYRLHDLFHAQNFQDTTTTQICEHLAMSESTLYRKLKLEGTSIQEIKDRAKLGFGLHLLQTTTESIGRISEKCGYSSQSRFSDRFKGHFGITPSELRKTKLTD